MKQYGTALRELLTLVAETDADADILLLPVTCLIVHPLVQGLGMWLGFAGWFTLYKIGSSADIPRKQYSIVHECNQIIQISFSPVGSLFV